jgi:hypothetical protein
MVGSQGRRLRRNVERPALFLGRLAFVSQPAAGASGTRAEPPPPNPGADEAARHRACATTAKMCPFHQDTAEGASRWREDCPEILSSPFASVRIRPASRDWKVSTHPLQWLRTDRMLPGV